MTALLQTVGLGKSFGHFAANADIDFSVDAGELRAVIGPNGAGKTTFFNMLSGTTDSTSGTITFKGNDITRLSGTRRVHLGIAKAFQTASIYPEQTVLQNCRLAALAHKQGAFALEILRRSSRISDVDAIAERAIDQLELGSVAEHPLGRSSRTATRSDSTSPSLSRPNRKSCCSTNPSPACRATKRARPKTLVRKLADTHDGADHRTRHGS